MNIASEIERLNALPRTADDSQLAVEGENAIWAAAENKSPELYRTATTLLKLATTNPSMLKTAPEALLRATTALAFQPVYDRWFDGGDIDADDLGLTYVGLAGVLKNSSGLNLDLTNSKVSPPVRAAFYMLVARNGDPGCIAIPASPKQDKKTGEDHRGRLVDRSTHLYGVVSGRLVPYKFSVDTGGNGSKINVGGLFKQAARYSYPNMFRAADGSRSLNDREGIRQAASLIIKNLIEEADGQRQDTAQEMLDYLSHASVKMLRMPQRYQTSGSPRRRENSA